MLKWIRKNIFCCIQNNARNKSTNISSIISSMENITYKETEIFIPQIRFAKVIKVYDGDTITVAAKLPFDTSPIYRFSVRLRSIDSPEIKGESEQECIQAIKSRDALHDLIFGKIIELKNNGKEKYGRLLADIYYNDIHVNRWMVDQGYAVKYDGGKKIRGSDWD
jgi:micrococcal nuclease